jgi:hypothetical protein
LAAGVAAEAAPGFARRPAGKEGVGSLTAFQPRARGRPEKYLLLRGAAPDAAVITREARTTMGPFGKVGALEKANQLLLQGHAGNLRRAHRAIQNVEGREAAKK